MKIVHESKVELLDWMGDDLSVVNAARVSFHKESEWETKEIPSLTDRGMDGEEFMIQDTVLSEKDEKLIGYLARHGHWSPFAHTAVKFRISAPIFVARQLVKHQVGLVWNEVSRRYVDDEPSFYIPQELRLKAANVKQGSSDEIHPVNESLVRRIIDSADNDLHNYNVLLSEGVAPEQARMVLPQNMMTEWIWTGSLLAFHRVCKQRLDPHAQAETREVAVAIDKKCEGLYPVSWSALKGN